jgi:hypothetical protein
MSIISQTERALSLAVEHVAWAAGQGMSADDVVRSVGAVPEAGQIPTWPEAVDAVADAWRALA